MSKEWDAMIARKRQAAPAPDPAGYLKQLLKWAEQNKGMDRGYLFNSYSRRIQAQTGTPKELRDEYVEKLRQMCGVA